MLGPGSEMGSELGLTTLDPVSEESNVENPLLDLPGKGLLS